MYMNECTFIYVTGWCMDYMVITGKYYTNTNRAAMGLSVTRL